MTYLFKFNKSITKGFSCFPIPDNFTTERKFGKSDFIYFFKVTSKKKHLLLLFKVKNKISHLLKGKVKLMELYFSKFLR